MDLKKIKITAFPIVLVLAVVLLLVIFTIEKSSWIPQPQTHNVQAEGGVGDRFLPSDPEKKLIAFANQRGLQLDAWPEEITSLLETIPEAEKFVLYYPLWKDVEQELDFSDYAYCTYVPYFYQWDPQWGYTQYSGDVMGLTGDGPTCLSMVAMHLLQDSQYSPRYIARLSEEKGYSTGDGGSRWTLISEGGKDLGLEVKEVPLVWGILESYLEEGHPVICIFEPGDIADSSHFVVMTAVEDGKIKLLDPYQPANSAILWDFEQIQDQIENMWVCKVPQ